MNENDVKILIFKINQEFYATDIVEVERILGYEEPTKLPDSPNFLEGVINYEGQILPVISLAKRFNLPDIDNRRESKVIVTKENGKKFGIIVDVVSEVRDISASDIEVPPEIVAGISQRYLKGLVKIDKKIIIFLKLGAILTDEEKLMIDK